MFATSRVRRCTEVAVSCLSAAQSRLVVVVVVVVSEKDSPRDEHARPTAYFQVAKELGAQQILQRPSPRPLPHQVA